MQNILKNCHPECSKQGFLPYGSEGSRFFGFQPQNDKKSVSPDTNNSQRGQGLTEVLVALLVGALLIGALVIVVITSLKNSQYAQTQVKASKYAQEGIDKVKVVRDRHGIVTLTNPPGNYNFENVWSIPFSSKYFKFSTDSNNNLSLNEITSPGLDPIPGEAGLNRQIIINDGAAQQKIVQVKVKWTDSTGDHESYLETILTDYFQ